MTGYLFGTIKAALISRRRYTATITAYLFMLGVLCQPVAAVGFGEAKVESLPGQILDIQIPLSDVDSSSDIRLLTHDASLYRKASAEYTALHERIVVELVTTVGKPYIAVSSIGAVNRKTFRLVVGVATQQSEHIKDYVITLTKPSPPPPSPVAMPTAEVLLQLLDYLATATGQSPTQILRALYRLIEPQQDSEPTAKPMVLRLIVDPPNEEFINGFRKVLSSEAAAIFQNDIQTDGVAVALNRALFGDEEYVVLKKLLSNSAVSSYQDDGTIAQRMEFMRERMAILETQLMRLRQQLDSQKEVLQDAKEGALWQSIAKDMVFKLRQLWDPRHLFATRFWIVTATLSGLLLLLMLWRQYRRMQIAASVAKPSPAVSTTVLPGQRELEKEFGLARETKTKPDIAADELSSQLNLAAVYIEMGDYSSANEVLGDVIERGDQAQVEKANQLREKLKGKMR